MSEADRPNMTSADYTVDLLNELFDGSPDRKAEDTVSGEVANLLDAAMESNLTAPIVSLFSHLKTIKFELGITPGAFNISRDTLTELALRHEHLDEHGVTVGGRINQALSIVGQANDRVTDYLSRQLEEAPSGIELWDELEENGRRIRRVLGMSDGDWQTYSGQLKYCIDTAGQLSEILNLPRNIVDEIEQVTARYRMRLTPYYASLIRRNRGNDPVLLQSVPTGEMTDNVGLEIPPVAADHSPARLIDQFYPRVVTIKVTNMCAMYCTHCLRIAHIGKKDKIFSDQTYEEALDYIRGNPRIRDVLITGGDALVLPNARIKKILAALDGIDHVRLKRLGTRIPVTAPQRIDAELLDILAASNEKKPVRLVTQINTAQEITPVSREAFKHISKSVSAVLNQAVLLKGINDSQVKMWKLCETIQEAYVRPYYVFNCSYRNPQFNHFRVPIEKGRDIIESMYGNISGDAIPRYIATAGGKIPLHRNNVAGADGQEVVLRKPWSGDTVNYPDADPVEYGNPDFSFRKKI